MGRAPCCEKLGLKKGPWSEEEDQILVSFIQKNGHGNWRRLPKRAGLLRCGKSCRLRWTNYLRPDIKRGNFTREEEDTIIKLHQELGNRWSAIATELPGRTNKEIKNVWHTHLKKRLSSNSRGSSHESSNGLPSISVTTDAEPLLSRELSFCTTLSSQPNTVLSSSMNLTMFDWHVSDLEGSMLSKEIMMPCCMSPQHHKEEDDMNFWMRMLIEAGDIQHL